MHPRYQEWLRYVFNREVRSPKWYFDADAVPFEVTPEDAAVLITQTFQRASVDLVQYTDDQVDQGLWFIVSSAGSDHMLALKSTEVELGKRLAGVESIYILYADYFTKHCTETLGHLSEPSPEINSICYMFWDICCLSYLGDAPDQVAMLDAVFSVLDRTLHLQHRACREAALHGLSEMTENDGCEQRVRDMIDKFVASTKVDEALHTYALKAREGNVL